MTKRFLGVVIISVFIMGCQTQSRSSRLGSSLGTRPTLNPYQSAYPGTANSYLNPYYSSYDDDGDDEKKGFLDSTMEFFGGNSDDPDSREKLKRGLLTTAAVIGAAAIGYGIYRHFKNSSQQAALAHEADQYERQQTIKDQNGELGRIAMSEKKENYRLKQESETMRTLMLVSQIKAMAEAKKKKERTDIEEDREDEDQDEEDSRETLTAESLTCLLGDGAKNSDDLRKDVESLTPPHKHH